MSRDSFWHSVAIKLSRQFLLCWLILVILVNRDLIDQNSCQFVPKTEVKLGWVVIWKFSNFRAQNRFCLSSIHCWRVLQLEDSFHKKSSFISIAESLKIFWSVGYVWCIVVIVFHYSFIFFQCASMKPLNNSLWNRIKETTSTWTIYCKVSYLRLRIFAKFCWCRRTSKQKLFEVGSG